jgi:prophage tail gpP-like protein
VLDVLAPFGFIELLTDQAGHVRMLTGKSLEGAMTAITVEALKAKDAQVQDNETAYGYCARLFSRLGVALRVNWEGLLLLSAPDYEQAPLYSIFEGDGTGDMALSMSLKETNSGQFSKVVIRGKSTEGAGKKQTAQPQAALRQEKFTGRFASVEEEAQALEVYTSRSADQPYSKVVEQSFASVQPLYTSTQQPFKPLYFVDKRSRDNARCASFAKLVHTKRSAQAFELTAVVDGLVSVTGAVWAMNTICRVDSNVLNIHDNMWVHEVQLEQSRGGSRTTLRLIPKHSLVLGDIPG